MNEMKKWVIQTAVDSAENKGKKLKDNEEASVPGEEWQRRRGAEDEVREVVGGADHRESFRKHTGFYASEKGSNGGGTWSAFPFNMSVAAVLRTGCKRATGKVGGRLGGYHISALQAFVTIVKRWGVHLVCDWCLPLPPWMFGFREHSNDDMCIEWWNLPQSNN